MTPGSKLGTGDAMLSETVSGSRSLDAHGDSSFCETCRHRSFAF